MNRCTKVRKSMRTILLCLASRSSRRRGEEGTRRVRACMQGDALNLPTQAKLRLAAADKLGSLSVSGGALENSTRN